MGPQRPGSQGAPKTGIWGPQRLRIQGEPNSRHPGGTPEIETRGTLKTEEPKDQGPRGTSKTEDSKDWGPRGPQGLGPGVHQRLGPQRLGTEGTPKPSNSKDWGPRGTPKTGDTKDRGLRGLQRVGLGAPQKLGTQGPQRLQTPKTGTRGPQKLGTQRTPKTRDPRGTPKTKDPKGWDQGHPKDFRPQRLGTQGDLKDWGPQRWETWGTPKTGNPKDYRPRRPQRPGDKIRDRTLRSKPGPGLKTQDPDWDQDRGLEPGSENREPKTETGTRRLEAPCTTRRWDISWTTPPFSSLRPKGTQLRWENHTQWTP